MPKMKTMTRAQVLEKLYKNQDVIISLKKGLVYHFDPEMQSAKPARMVQGLVVSVDDNYIHLGMAEEIALSVDLNDISVIFKNQTIDEEMLQHMNVSGESEH